MAFIMQFFRFTASFFISFLVAQSAMADLPSVAYYELINADTNQVIRSITGGQTINLAELPTRNLNFKAVTFDNPGSVIFEYDFFGQNETRMENVAPFAAFGDSNGNYKGKKLTPGSYSIVGRPFTQRRGRGEEGQTYFLVFNIIDEPLQPPVLPSVSSYNLINADTNEVIRSITGGQTINLAELPTRNLNFQAVTFDNPASVVFEYNFFGQKDARTENVAPFAAFGDSNGNYNGLKLSPGTYSLVGRPFSKKNGQGEEGQTYFLLFFVIDEAPQ